MAVAVQVFDDGHPGVPADALNQPLAAARNDHVDKLRHGDQVAHRVPVGGGHQLHHIAGQASLRQRLLHQRCQRLVRLDRLGAAAQNTGVAAFDGQAGRFNRDVGAAFINHAEHANGHPHLPHANAAGLLFHADDVADHVRHHGELLTADGHCVDGLRRQREPVQHRPGQPGGSRPVQIALVRLLQAGDVLTQQSRQARQRLVFSRRRRLGHLR